MTRPKRIVLDANILIRAVLGVRVTALLERYSGRVGFYTPERCFEDAARYLPPIFAKRPHMDLGTAMQALSALMRIVHPLDETVYNTFEAEARRRIEAFDPHDWPIVALAMFLDCPIWTEDKDFFGIGIPTWRTQHVEIYLSD